MLTVPALEAAGIVKRYGATLANDDVDLTVASGEIHAVMGENGAGKSTLMSILYGLQQPDAGRLLLQGQEVRLRSPLDAIAKGMGMVHQSFKLFNGLTVWENIVFGAEPRRGLFIDSATARQAIAALGEHHGLSVDPDARVGTLSVGVRQRVEILKALYREARVLILDEPTAVLTPQESAGLFLMMRRLTADGRSILFVTHKLQEVMEISDRVTVLRDGRVAARLRTSETTPQDIVRAMTGRTIALTAAPSQAQRGRPLLEATDLTVAGPGNRPALDRVSLTVHAGEIVGIAGVAGNGQSELVEALTGLRPLSGGTVHVDGSAVTGADVAGHRAAGLAYIPEDRGNVGSALAASAAENLAMGFHNRPPLAQHGRINRAAMTERARGLIERFDILIAGPEAPVGSLSGGNLQKVVVARELSHEAPVLIAEQPTRGVDVGATEYIHAQLLAERDKGHGVLLVSAELSEILSLSDRVLVMYEGRIIAEVPRAKANPDSIGLLMAGRSVAAA